MARRKGITRKEGLINYFNAKREEGKGMLYVILIERKRTEDSCKTTVKHYISMNTLKSIIDNSDDDLIGYWEKLNIDFKVVNFFWESEEDEINKHKDVVYSEDYREKTFNLS